MLSNGSDPPKELVEVSLRNKVNPLRKDTEKHDGSGATLWSQWFEKGVNAAVAAVAAEKSAVAVSE